MLASFDSAAAMAARGDMGVAQMHALASLVANPRVKEHLADGEELLVGQAAELDFDDYVVLLANWERVADEDGAHHDSERTHRNRKASGSIVGNQFFLDAVCGLAQGLQMKEILEAIAKSEWMADWEAGLAIHGDAMAAHLMDRTDPQRRMDALLAIFLKAASGETETTGTGFTINLNVGLPAFEHHLAQAMGAKPARLDPNDPHNKCETNTGVPVDPFDMLVAATIGNVRRVVLDSTGVVVNMGRKQRLFTGPLHDAVLMHSRWCVPRLPRASSPMRSRPRAPLGQRRPDQHPQRWPTVWPPQQVESNRLPHLARPRRPLAPLPTRRHRNRLEVSDQKRDRPNLRHARSDVSRLTPGRQVVVKTPRAAGTTKGTGGS